MATYLADTNLLLRLADKASPQHPIATDALARLLGQGDEVYLTPQNFVGNVFYGSEGVMVCPSYTSAFVMDSKGDIVTKFTGGDDHFGNFIRAVRSGRREALHADI